MSERRFHGDPGRLRAPERLALLEVDRVVATSLDGLSAVTVLDVGTGTGVFAEAFSSRGLRVTGIDVDPALLELARGHAPGGSFEVAEAERLPFPDGAFDLVFLGHVLHESDDPGKALGEAARVAGKRVVVLEWPYREEEHGPPLEHRLKPEEIDALLASQRVRGFERMTLAHMELYRIAV